MIIFCKRIIFVKSRMISASFKRTLFCISFTSVLSSVRIEFQRVTSDYLEVSRTVRGVMSGFDSVTSKIFVCLGSFIFRRKHTKLVN